MKEGRVRERLVEGDRKGERTNEGGEKIEQTASGPNNELLRSRGEKINSGQAE